jgi:hypothetical protein
MKSTLALSAALFALSVAVSGADAAGTQQSTMTPSPAFEQVDTNRDGVVTKEEITAAKALQNTSFDSADQNKDGKLNKAEYDAASKIHDPQQGG